MGRRLSHAEIEHIKRRERRNLKGGQAFISALLSALVCMPLMAVWLIVSPELACVLGLVWLIFLWWWVCYRLRAMVDEVGEQTQWLQASFSAHPVYAHRNFHFDYRFGDYTIAGSNLLNNWFIDNTLNTHTLYRIEAVTLTCPQTSAVSYYLFRETLVEATPTQVVANQAVPQAAR